MEFAHASLAQTMSASDDTFEIALTKPIDAVRSTLREQTRQERDGTGPISWNIRSMLIEPRVDGHIEFVCSFGLQTIDDVEQPTETAKVERHFGRKRMAESQKRCEIEHPKILHGIESRSRVRQT